MNNIFTDTKVTVTHASAVLCDVGYHISSEGEIYFEGKNYRFVEEGCEYNGYSSYDYFLRITDKNGTPLDAPKTESTIRVLVDNAISDYLYVNRIGSISEPW